ncbi:hypothetical protein V494_01270 [Pseudogymnoascus sp. VKM F-4513 (FW-928)]|nr:hypothetical protein V494_01270 [Pseudogymnoascus sp. VKM F-4513 (FW-928)]
MSSEHGPNFSDNAESTGMVWIHVAFPITFVAAVLVRIRLWWRFSQVGSIGKSDWCILAALANALIQLAVGAVAMLRWGFGHHVQYLIKHNGIQYVQMSGMVNKQPLSPFLELADSTSTSTSTRSSTKCLSPSPSSPSSIYTSTLLPDTPASAPFAK